jgi:NAD(P)-dependent dehydrogenase (short-subunit alcohol dehydrogenase family)
MRRLLDAALDASIVFSFDRSGFTRHARAFRPTDLAVDLTGRVCLVTGANSGIGRATSLALARRGAELWLLCRDPGRGRQAEAALRRESGNARVHFAPLDVSRLGSVRAFAADFPHERVDVLVHNAGVLPALREETEDGLELTLATNVVGPFELTRRLEPKLRAAGAARVIFVSSGGMYTQRLSVDDACWCARPYDGVRAYAQTKRMQAVLARLLAVRWEGTGIVCHAMHPGWADTPSVRTSLPRFWRATRAILRTPEQAADTVVWLAVASAAVRRSGLFWFDRAPRTPYLLPFTRESEAERQRLWRLVHELAGRAAAAAAPAVGTELASHAV